jgi:hypothetical protein
VRQSSSRRAVRPLGRTLNLGEWGQFGLDVQNTGFYDAWNVTLLDRLPDGPTGGMCALTPQVLSVQVFAADGVTAVPGKGPLIAGTDYTLSYDVASCQLLLRTLTAAGSIGPTERLRVTYRTQLDADTQDARPTSRAAMVQRRQQQCRPHDLHAHDERRSARSTTRTPIP